MHIPTCESCEVDILRFDEALNRSLAQSDVGYDTEKWLYVPNFYSEYRYILGTYGKNPLICIGINPSTAEPDKLDPTLQSVSRIAAGNGFDSFIMFNVYAQRATRPDDMDQSWNKELHRENMLAFEHILKGVAPGNAPAVWAAWGTIIEKRDYLPLCVEEMVSIGKKFGSRWLSAGKRSKAGHPHHPLYLKATSPVEDFPVEEYLNSIKKADA